MSHPWSCEVSLNPLMEGRIDIRDNKMPQWALFVIQWLQKSEENVLILNGFQQWSAIRQIQLSRL